jgi:hypothetical protein
VTAGAAPGIETHLRVTAYHQVGTPLLSEPSSILSDMYCELNQLQPTKPTCCCQPIVDYLQPTLCPDTTLNVVLMLVCACPSWHCGTPSPWPRSLAAW